MDRVLYVAMNAADQAMQSMQANNNNLANIRTTGFKADLLQFRSEAVDGDGMKTRYYSVADDQATDLKPGHLHTTGRSLDIAIKGEGYLAVQSDSGQERFTRSGNLQILADGTLSDNQGHPVIGNNGLINLPPAKRVEIGEDGTISVLPLGGDTDSLAVIDRIKLVSLDSKLVRKNKDGLFYMAEGTPETNASIRVQAGALEASNVNGIGAMVKMIELNRQYEQAMKLIKVAEEDDSKSARILQD